MFKRWDKQCSKRKKKFFVFYARELVWTSLDYRVLGHEYTRQSRVPGLDNTLHLITCHFFPSNTTFKHTHTHTLFISHIHTDIYTTIYPDTYILTRTHSNNDMIMNMHEFYLIKFSPRSNNVVLSFLYISIYPQTL